MAYGMTWEDTGTSLARTVERQVYCESRQLKWDWDNKNNNNSK